MDRPTLFPECCFYSLEPFPKLFSLWQSKEVLWPFCTALCLDHFVQYIKQSTVKEGKKEEKISISL